VAVVPAKKFLDFVKTLSAEEISAKLDRNASGSTSHRQHSARAADIG